MNIVDDWNLYPILSKDGYFCWSAKGYRWIPSWACRPLIRSWNRINCWRIGHFWIPIDPDPDGRIPCAHCGARRDATDEDNP